MRYLPLFRDINGRDCLVVGGGTVAFRKIRLLRRAGGRVTVIAPSITGKLIAFGETDNIDFILRPFEADDVAGRVLEILAPHLNPSQVAELRELHEHHEWLLVAEHGTQFLDDADGRLSAEDFERVSEGRVALGGYPLAPAYQQDD